MVFSRGWDNSAPPGTRAAKEIDDAIRELRVDWDERAAAKLFTTAMPNTTVEADLVVKPEVLGNVNGKILVIHGVDFQIESTDDGNYGDTGLSGLGTFEPFQAAVHLPNGSVVTRVRFLLTLSGPAQTVTCDFKSMFFDTSLTVVSELPAALTKTTNTTAIIDTGVLAPADEFAIDSHYAYFVTADSNGGITAGFTIHAAEITYNTPDCRNTI